MLPKVPPSNLRSSLPYANINTPIPNQSAVYAELFPPPEPFQINLQNIFEYIPRHWKLYKNPQTEEVFISSSQAQVIRDQILEQRKEELIQYYTQIQNEYMTAHEYAQNLGNAVVVPAWERPSELYDY